MASRVRAAAVYNGFKVAAASGVAVAPRLQANIKIVRTTIPAIVIRLTFIATSGSFCVAL